jgi:hypothetical protein
MSDGRISVPVSCTLDDQAARDQRLAEWQSLLARADEREAIRGGMRLVFAPGPDVAAEIGRLAALEAACCACMDFTVHVGNDRTTLDVCAPDEAADLVVKLFGPEG